MTSPCGFADVEPLAWKRVQDHSGIKDTLAKTLKVKWAEATEGPDQDQNDTVVLMAPGDESFRKKLLQAQELCEECKPLILARKQILTATQRDSTTEAEKISRSYRLNPVDGVLERSVPVTKTTLWVPVMPSIVIPAGYFDGHQHEDGLTWRRYAFNLAHTTFLEPHCNSNSTWQVLKRMGQWNRMLKDLDIWINDCAACHQYRTVGVMAPMRSTMKSIDTFHKLPWNDVIIDCQGPFTRSQKGNGYTVNLSLHIPGSV